MIQNPALKIINLNNVDPDITTVYMALINSSKSDVVSVDLPMIAKETDIPLATVSKCLNILDKLHCITKIDKNLYNVDNIFNKEVKNE